MAERKLEITIVGDASKATKALGDVGESANKLEGKIGGLSSTFETVGATAAGFIVGGAIAKAPGFLMDAAKGAAEDEQATRRLEQALRNAGGAFDENLAKVNDRIDAAQELAFTDDDVRDSFQSLLAATGDTDEALRRQAAAMDLARGAGIPLETATKMLGKLNAENVEVFKKLGITLGDNATEADALAAVQAKFGGQAKAYAESTAGQFEIAQIKMAELQESIGAALIPVMAQAGAILSGIVVPAMQQVADAVIPIVTGIGEKLAPAFDFIVSNAEPIAAAVGAVAAVIAGSMVPAVVAWTGAEIAKAAALVASAAAFLVANAPLIAAAAAIALVAAGVVLLIQHWDEITAKFPILGEIADGVKARLLAFGGWITGSFVPAVQKIAEAVSETVSKAVGFVREHWDEISAVITPAVEAVRVVIQTAWAQIQTNIQTAIGVVSGIVNTLSALLRGDFSGAWEGVKQTVSAVWEGIKGTVSNGIEAIRGLAPLMLSAATAVGSAFVDGLKSALETGINIAGSIADAVGRAIRGAFNAVIDQINRAVEISFDTHIPGVGSITIDPPDIPHLARGGLIVAGDNPSGIEAVVPLERAGEFGFGGAGRIENHYHFNAPFFGGTYEELARQIDLTLRRSGQRGIIQST